MPKDTPELAEILIKRLLTERKQRYNNGIYHFIQTELAYNSNRIEGSKLSKEHTINLFNTKSIIAMKDEVIRSDDIVETNNHFRAFDYILDIYDEPLSEEIIKRIHFILKNNTSNSYLEWFNVGEYKQEENMIGDMFTTAPEKVAAEIQSLLRKYLSKRNISFDDIIEFHYEFEKIHPFQDGNGRVGRLIMFKECLKYGIIPFITNEQHKMYYYNGLRQYKIEKGYLTDTCLSAQDTMIVYCRRLISEFNRIYVS